MDQSDYINLSVDSVVQNIVLGVVLAALVLLVFLRDLGANDRYRHFHAGLYHFGLPGHECAGYHHEHDESGRFGHGRRHDRG